MQQSTGAQEAREETRLPHANAEVEKPKAKDPADIVPVTTHTEEQHSQGFALWLIEHRQEIDAAQERQGGDLAYRIHAHNRNECHTEDHHQRRMRFADAVEQPAKNPKQIDEFNRATHFGGDADAEKPLGSEDVVGGRRRVSRYEQLAGNIDDAEVAGHSVYQIQYACDPGGPFG
jgi:hypothetical protein